jgi:hypothetical protein
VGIGAEFSNWLGSTLGLFVQHVAYFVAFVVLVIGIVKMVHKLSQGHGGRAVLDLGITVAGVVVLGDLALVGLFLTWMSSLVTALAHSLPS